MNERIKLISDVQVEVTANLEGTRYRYTLRPTEMLSMECVYLAHTYDWDTMGRMASVEVDNCYTQTGSFAALSDESAVPFVGKRMRRKLAVCYQGCGERECEILKCTDDRVWILEGETVLPRSVPINDITLLPLVTPAPKYRPYTPVEAAAHLGRRFVERPRRRLEFDACKISSGYVHDQNGSAHSFEAMAKNYEWADDGTPCGVPL